MKLLTCHQLGLGNGMMLNYDPLQYLPTSEELPSSDETPVDNELQDTIPHLLKSILAIIWSERRDWFFGIDMGYYYHPKQSAIVPDGFLSLGVQRWKTRPKGRQGRLSYVLWEENGVVPILALEIVSQTYNGEYDQKKLDYADLGLLYYVIYDSDNFQPRKGDSFEVHRLVDGVYVRQPGNPVWIPEIGLGIGTAEGTYLDWTREWLYWYDQNARRYPSENERTQQAEQRATQAQQELEALKSRLKQMGINPDQLLD